MIYYIQAKARRRRYLISAAARQAIYSIPYLPAAVNRTARKKNQKFFENLLIKPDICDILYTRTAETPFGTKPSDYPASLESRACRGMTTTGLSRACSDSLISSLFHDKCIVAVSAAIILYICITSTVVSAICSRISDTENVKRSLTVEYTRYL